MPWSAGLVGWPAVFAATTAFSFAFLTNSRWLGFVGAGIAAPFCLFAGGYPLFHWAAPVALAANVLAAYLVYRGRPDVAFASLLPFILIVTVLAVFGLRGITLVRQLDLIRLKRDTPYRNLSRSRESEQEFDCERAVGGHD
jgi:hypothetical protein